MLRGPDFPADFAEGALAWLAELSAVSLGVVTALRDSGLLEPFEGFLSCGLRRAPCAFASDQDLKTPHTLSRNFLTTGGLSRRENNILCIHIIRTIAFYPD